MEQQRLSTPETRRTTHARVDPIQEEEELHFNVSEEDEERTETGGNEDEEDPLNVPIKTLHIDGGGTLNIEKYVYDTIKGFMVRLEMQGTVEELVLSVKVQSDEDVTELLSDLGKNCLKKVICEQVIGIGPYGSSDLGRALREDKSVTATDIATMSRQEWKEYYEFDMPIASARRLKAFHYWLANPAPGTPEESQSTEQRVFNLTREKFEHFMMNVWRKPTMEAAQLQDSTQIPDLAGFDVSRDQEQEKSKATVQQGDDDGFIPVAGKNSRRASIAAARRQSQVGTGSGFTPKKVQFQTPVSTTASPRTAGVYGNKLQYMSKTTSPSSSASVSAPAASPMSSVPFVGAVIVGMNADGTPIYGLPASVSSKYTKAEEFDKGGRRSTQDYTTFQNREGWGKWQRALLGTALDHKCINVLNPNYSPDPNDAEEVELFESQKRFMYSVFTKVVTEPSAVDILRNYSDPSDSKFGDSQMLYADLCDHFEGGAIGQVTVSQLETQLTTMRLNRSWSKSVTQFVNSVASKIKDHKELTNNSHGELYYIEKLNTTFEEHRDMNAHIQTLKSQRATLERAGVSLQAETYESQLFELRQQATILDTRYNKDSRRRANEANSSRNDSGGGRGGGRGRGGNGGGRGRGNGGGRGSGGGNRNGWLPREEWIKLSEEEKERRRASRRSNSGGDNKDSRSSHNTNVSNNDGGNSGNDSNRQQQSSSASQQQSESGGTTGPGTMVRQMMSNAQTRSSNSANVEQEITVNGRRYRIASTTYRISQSGQDQLEGALVDGGANGGMLGSDARVLEFVEGAKVDVTGIADAEVTDLRIAQGAALVETVNDGPIIIIMSQYANLGRGKTIHSKGQMENFGLVVDDRRRLNGGNQCIITQEGYVIPLHIRDGLPRFDMSPPTDEDLEKYPHVFITSDAPWDPHCLDEEFTEDFHDAVMELPEVVERRENRDTRVDDQGNLRRTYEDYQALFHAQDDFIAANSLEVEYTERWYNASSTGVVFLDENGEMVDYIPQKQDVFQSMVQRLASLPYSMFPNRLRRFFPKVETLKPFFGWVSNDKIKGCLDSTTQHYRGVVHYPFRKHFKSRFPAANVPRLNEWQATDTFFSDTPAADDGIPGHGGSTMLQVFVGLDSAHTAGYPMKSEKQVPEAIEEQIRKVGTPIGLMSDNAKSEMHGRAKDLLRMYEIDDRQSEPEYQHQNPAERQIQDVKRMMNNVMDRTGCPQRWWLLVALFVIMLKNHLPNSHGEIPLTKVSGRIPDVSKFMHFHFWQEVFVESHKEGKKEELARWVMPAENTGDELTYMVLLEDTEQLVPRSNVRPAKDPLYPNLRVRPKVEDLRSNVPVVETVSDDDGDFVRPTGTSGESAAPAQGPIKNVQDFYDVPISLPKFSPEELLGLTFLHELDDGQRVRATISKKILDRDAENHERIKMLISYDDDRVEEIVSYNELCDIVAEQHEKEAQGLTDLFTFRKVLRHEGPLRPGDSNYKGSGYNVEVLWNDGSKTWEPVAMMIASDPVTMAVYAKEHELLDTPGWKKLKSYARRAKKLMRMVNANKRAQRYNSVTYKFGVRLPRNVKEAYTLDAQNGNTYWKDAMELEISQLMEYKTFKDMGRHASVPPGYQQIPLRMVFDVKQSLKRKARLVARGDKTEPPRDSVYSGVASLRSLRIVTFLAELNGLHLTGGDIGNAYLEAYTKEKVCTVAGPEFGPLEGHLLLIDKALYGLRTSGARFHAKFADTLRTLGFFPSYADPDVWLRDAGDCYEYVVVYVDDILTALKDPEAFYSAIQSDPWNYKLKNVEEPKYHLGGDFFRDSDGTFCYGAQTYVKRMCENYEDIFGEPVKEYFSPLEKGDQPELDTSTELGPDDVEKFQSLIGAVQWTVTLSRFDVAHACMSLGRFRASPRQGHLDRLRRVIGYMKKKRGGAIRFRTGIPDWENSFPEPIKYDWAESVYGCPQEEIDSRAPTPKGKYVRTTSFVDANLMHDVVTGRSCTGVLEFLNQTPIDWFSKRQNQVETATYGSEFMAARQAVERIIDLRYTLRSFGVPLDGPAWMFGDNKSVVTSSTIPHSSLGKRWNALSYHRVREAIAGGWLRFEHIPGSENPSDILTKSLAWNVLRVYVEPLLFWKGDTAEAPSGSSNPEGSIERPAHGTTRESGVSGLDQEVSPDVDSNQTHDPDGAHGVPAFHQLWNNQYAALMDSDGTE